MVPCPTFLSMKTRLISTILLLIDCIIVFGQTSPGGVSGNLIWWVKANAETYNAGTTLATDGQTVLRWDNQVATTNNAVNSDNSTKPIYRQSVINGNPALEFNGTKYLDSELVSGIGATSSFNIFLVFKQNSYQTNGGVNDGEGTFIIDRPTATNNLTSFKVVDTNKYFYQRRQDDGGNLGGPVSITPVNTTSFVITEYYRNRISAANFREGILLDGRLDIDQGSAPTANITGPAIRIGRHATNPPGGLDGYFAEMIVYNTNLSASDRQKVETYLAIKYGITLTSTTDYVRRDGTVIYPSTSTHNGFVSDIAGIGRDNGGTGSGLLQNSSQSQNANSVVRIASPSDLGNNEFLVWGSNNGNLVVPSTSDLPTGIVRKLSRIWRVAETGDVGSFTLTVDLSAVPGSKNAADLRLLVDTNGTFASGATQYSVSSSSGSTFTFANVSITNNDYFTIGTINAASTPLPIELTAFNVAYESPIVTTSWQTASELNNDYFTLERAGKDLVFEEVGRKPGAGTSKVLHSYSMIDQYPYEGTSYYRLKQTDFDGTSTYSDTKYMFIEETKKQIAVFPNPNEGKQIEIAFGNKRFNLNYISVINQQGRVIETSYAIGSDLQQYSIELQQKLPPGLYIVKVHYNGKDEFVKLLVH